MSSRTSRVVPLVALSLWVMACGGGAPTSAPAGRSTAIDAGAIYLQGLHASELAKTARGRGLVCQEPVQVRDMKHWICQASTPLITYMVEFYGKEPGRLEYIRAVVTQSGAPKAALAMAFLTSFANARYNGADPAKATVWIEQQLAAGGQTMIGPASLKLSGDPGRAVLEIKAPGSEW